MDFWQLLKHWAPSDLQQHSNVLLIKISTALGRSKNLTKHLFRQLHIFHNPSRENPYILLSNYSAGRHVLLRQAVARGHIFGISLESHMDETEPPESFNNISTSIFIASLQTSPFTRSIHILQEATTDMISCCIHLYFFSQPFFLLLGDFIAVLSATNLGIKVCACDHLAPQITNVSIIILVCMHCSMQGLVQSWKNFVYMDFFFLGLKIFHKVLRKLKEIRKKKQTNYLRNSWLRAWKALFCS